ncbi:hypothetical protein QQZ08_004624 [Neonectria magnoliae]|uniref:Cytochrome P450 n=1 Tax=Neonectria magnoliae TaxID=2732573 RepID=A0ABR1I759_9HYPO
MNLVDHIKTEASAIILRITYGYSIEPLKADPLTRLIERMTQGASLASVPLAWPVDILPILEYFPERLPGMSFKKKFAREWNEITRMVIETPYKFVQQQMEEGTHRLSYVSSLIEQHDDGGGENGRLNEDSENAIERTAAVMYAGGGDTTVSSINSLVLAMVLFPAVQKKAQQEIDTVVGANRLPSHGDRDNLPYVKALVEETIRWSPVVPMGMAHKVDEDINYAGLHISKRT